MEALNLWNKKLTSVLVEHMQFQDFETLRALRTREYTKLFDLRFQRAVTALYKFEGEKIVTLCSKIDELIERAENTVKDLTLAKKKLPFWKIFAAKQIETDIRIYSGMLLAYSAAKAILIQCPPKE